MREILRKLLDTHGFDVLSAADGAEAIALFRRYKNEIRAAIIDLRMQFMDAPTTIRVLQGMNPELKIIAVGGPDDNNLPGCTLLQKPFTISSLLGALSSKKPAE
jgi:DNA-binding response OmpR family regulator